MSEDEPKIPELHHYDAECGLLCSVLLKPKLVDEVSDFLRPEHFYFPVHNLIFQTMLSLHWDNKPIDASALSAILRGNSVIEEHGGPKYLAGLLSFGAIAMPSQTKHYGEIIIDYSMRRALVERAEDLKASCCEPLVERTARQVLDMHEESLLRISGLKDGAGGLVAFNAVLQATREQWSREDKGERGVPTGFPELDKLLGGLHPTDLLIVAGRASMGKTAFALNLAYNVAHYFDTTDDLEHHHKQVVFFSLEMSAEQLGSRIVTGKAKIIAPRNRWGRPLTGEEWRTVNDLSYTAGKLPFWIDDTADQTVARMRARCVRLHRRKRIGVIVVDYLQLMDSGTKGGRENRVEQVSAITRGLKKMAKELGVPVIALSQLSRAVENRDSKRPILSDLRESGSIEQDSDVVMFPFRMEYYLSAEGKPERKKGEADSNYAVRVSTYHSQLEESEGKCEIIVAKHRHGPLGSVMLDFDKQHTWFASPESPQGDLI